ncbi:Heterogeneous nuclear ribonucleoprotein Q [Monoraphidium neglectum]|uniref:Heterogeneous nuclear ribonucleoprotein Q n=1 Tax=Monoraphidium neglectum TaxID=145388 RepID=A0A0D2MXI6_9CHLO|nr:Heterogeneous nuclear ribonucleoprotein Q [Monoraphidium neglectum]KIZ07180.1 Heterogeneous nuclear ribonucleoprotein Q [Monoraphidium neglectum]|eukprot:XP_013906199.1 Heterogeneous nuclear ribonucleoprotein Q [Monoraphidium neglectum]
MEDASREDAVYDYGEDDDGDAFDAGGGGAGGDNADDYDFAAAAGGGSGGGYDGGGGDGGDGDGVYDAAANGGDGNGGGYDDGSAGAGAAGAGLGGFGAAGSAAFGGVALTGGVHTESDPMSLPPHGTEVFVANLPHETTEEQIREFVAGAVTGLQLHSVRVPRAGSDSRGAKNKGFAFAVFYSKEDAEAGVERLNGRNIGGRATRASLSTSNNRLFLGNVPRATTAQELRQALEREVVGLEDVDLVSDKEHSGQNRGFGFLTFYNHAAADRARKKLEQGFSVGNRAINVSWAEMKNKQQGPADTGVKAVYVGGLPQDATAEALREIFSQHGERRGL